MCHVLKYRIVYMNNSSGYTHLVCGLKTWRHLMNVRMLEYLWLPTSLFYLHSYPILTDYIFSILLFTTLFASSFEVKIVENISWKLEKKFFFSCKNYLAQYPMNYDGRLFELSLDVECCLWIPNNTIQSNTKQINKSL